MMLFSRTGLVFTSILLLSWGQLSPAASETVNLTCRIKNEHGKAIQGIRVQAVSERVLVTAYSNKKGVCELPLQAGRGFDLLVSGRSCTPYRQHLVTSASDQTPALDIFMKAGIDSIAPGSLDQAQLYLSQDQQQALDSMLMTGDRVDPETGVFQQFHDPWRRSRAHLFAAWILHMLGREAEAENQFKLSGSRWYGNIRGDMDFKAGQFEDALSWFQQGESCLERAISLKELSRHFQRQLDLPRRDLCHELAWEDYRTVLIDPLFPWDPQLMSVFSDLFASDWAGKHRAKAVTPELEQLLRMAGEYCRQLEKRSLFYYCIEDKTDTIEVNPALYKGERDPVEYCEIPPDPPHRTEEFYDPVRIYRTYEIQLVQTDAGTIDEIRTGGTQRVDRNVASKYVETYEIKKAHFGPNTIIGEDVQSLYFYRIAGRETLFDTETVIVEAIPRRIGVNPLFPGRIWISRQDGSVLKIERFYQTQETRLGLRRRSLLLDLTSRFLFSSEYGQQKNGFRYLSRNLLQEIYSEKEAQRLVRITVESIYKDYKFFGVGSTYTVEPVEE